VVTWIASAVARTDAPGCWARANALVRGAMPDMAEITHYADLLGGVIEVVSAFESVEPVRPFGAGRRKLRVRHCFSEDGAGETHGHFEPVWSYMVEQPESFLPYTAYRGSPSYDPVRWAHGGHPRGPGRSRQRAAAAAATELD